MVPFIVAEEPIHVVRLVYVVTPYILRTLLATGLTVRFRFSPICLRYNTVTWLQTSAKYQNIPETPKMQQSLVVNDTLWQLQGMKLS